MPTRYETNLKARIQADAATVLDNWGETITRRIAGDESDTESVIAVVDKDALIQADPVGDTPAGRRVVKEIVLEMLDSQEVTLDDTFVLTNGEVWAVVATPARDDGLKSVVCRRSDGGTSKRTRVRP